MISIIAGLNWPKILFMQDFGYDLRAFYLAAKKSQSDIICCLNSFSEILADGWLEKLTRPLWHDDYDSDIGLVGTTGSWESFGTTFLKRFFFHPFPNPHIRTNAFAMRCEDMLRVWPRYVWTKRGAYLFESGKNNLLERVEEQGLEAVVVNADGKVFVKGDWYKSETFRTPRTHKLLVADNQTRYYDDSHMKERLELMKLAWGNKF